MNGVVVLHVALPYCAGGLRGWAQHQRHIQQEWRPYHSNVIASPAAASLPCFAAEGERTLLLCFATDHYRVANLRKRCSKVSILAPASNRCEGIERNTTEPRAVAFSSVLRPPHAVRRAHNNWKQMPGSRRNVLSAAVGDRITATRSSTRQKGCILPPSYVVKRARSGEKRQQCAKAQPLPSLQPTSAFKSLT